MKVNAARLRANVEKLGSIGAVPEGGVCRFTYSKEYFESVEYVKGLMEQAGMEVRVDPVSNIIGTYKGKSEDMLLLGSHIDSVPHAGMFDGCLGVLSAIEAVHTIHESGQQPKHTLQVVAFAEEEGNTVVGLLGSGAFVDRISLTEDAKERLQGFGLSEKDVADSKSKELDKIKGYLELHIEQGGVLDHRKIDIGVVNGIVGIMRFAVTIYGKANHAGSTPMTLRDDAMVKAANLISELDKLARGIDPEMVYTTGYLNILPGAYNVIPGQVDVVVEVRAMKQESLDIAHRYILNRFGPDEVKMETMFEQVPVPMDEGFKATIATAAEELGLSSIVMNSGAGHDTMVIAERIDRCGMIFVPSKGGISHAPEEWTEWKDTENGANVLLHTLLKLDAEL